MAHRGFFQNNSNHDEFMNNFLFKDLLDDEANLLDPSINIGSEDQLWSIKFEGQCENL